MVSANFLLQKLQPYKKQNIVLVQDQNVGDIINGILKTHGKYFDQYDKILPYFEDDDIVETAKNVFEFLKENCKYVIESDKKQTLRSPSAIIATGKTVGCDCKSYSLFFGGILSAYKRKYNTDDKLYYRFAGYNGKDLQHVFVVVDHDGNKYWCDAVLDYFNDRSKIPTKIKDKNMALISMAGIGNNISKQISDYTSIGKSRMVFGIGDNTSSNTTTSLPGGIDAEKVIKFITNIFPNIRKTDPLVDPANTEYGRKMYLNMYPDVARSDVFGPNPFIHFADYGHKEGRYWLENPLVTKETVDDYYSRYPDVKENYSSSVLQHYINYGKSEGRTIKLKLSENQKDNLDKILRDGEIPPPPPPGKTAGISPLILLALIGAGAAFFLRKK